MKNKEISKKVLSIVAITILLVTLIVVLSIFNSQRIKTIDSSRDLRLKKEYSEKINDIATDVQLMVFIEEVIKGYNEVAEGSKAGEKFAFWDINSSMTAII